MRNTIKILGIIALVAVIGFSMVACGGTPKAVVTDELDTAIRDTSDYLNDNIPARSKIVILNIQSDSEALSNYIIDELIANTVNDKVFTVVDRAQLDAIRAEQNFQFSGEVDDNLALEVGKFFGAQSIVSGTVSMLGSRYRMTIRALEVQTAQVQGQFNKNINTSETLTALLNSRSRSGGTATAGGSGGRTQAGTTSGGTATAAATPVAPTRLANGTYTFRPRPQAYKDGIPIETYIFQIVVRGNYFLVYLGNSARGPAQNSYVLAFDGDCMLTNLDNPSRSWTTKSVGEDDRDLGSVIYSFQNVTGNRFSLENLQKGGHWYGGIFEEFDLSKADYEP